MPRKSPQPLAVPIGELAQRTGLAVSTIRRLSKSDPTFPTPFTLENGGHLRWPFPETLAWLEAKAGRPLSRDERAA